MAVIAKSAVVRYGLCGMLQLNQEFTPLGCNAPLEPASADWLGADFVIVEFGPQSGPDIAELVARCRHSSTPVIVLLSTAEQEVLDRAVRMPAQGFLIQQELTPDELINALYKVADGTVHLPAVFADRLLYRARRQDADEPPPCAHNTLTAREQQTLELLVHGLSNKQLARRLHISEHGAKRLVANVLSKLNCPNRTMAVAVALRERLVERPPVRG